MTLARTKGHQLSKDAGARFTAGGPRIRQHLSKLANGAVSWQPLTDPSTGDPVIASGLGHLVWIPLGIDTAGSASASDVVLWEPWQDGHLLVSGWPFAGEVVQWIAAEAVCRGATVTRAHPEHNRRNALAALKATLRYTRHLQRQDDFGPVEHLHVLFDRTQWQPRSRHGQAWLDLITQTASNPPPGFTLLLATDPNSRLAQAVTTNGSHTSIDLPRRTYTQDEYDHPRTWTASITHLNSPPVLVRMPNPIHDRITGQA